jgi:DNA-directed RNA polymerase specialized sigma24 family protein
VRRLALPVLGRATSLERTTQPDPADEVTRRQIVDRALDGLRPEVRATLILRHYYGYDYAQIGTFLGISSGTVGSTLSRAHAAIRRRLEAEDPAAAVLDDGAPSTTGSATRRSASTEPPEVLP